VIRAALGLLLAALLLPLAGVPAQAADTDQNGSLRIVLDSLTPAAPGENAVLRIRGRVANVGDLVAEDLVVRLRRSSTPLTDRIQVAEIADAGLVAVGGEPTDVPLDGTSVTPIDALPPGELVPFSIRVPMASLGFGAPGAYALAVEVLARQQGGDGASERRGILRTFVPWFPNGADVEPLRLAWLWPLAEWPAETVSGVLLNEQTPDELRPEGRLGQLVAIGQRHQATVSWIADPSLLQTAGEIAEGYRVLRDGEVVVGGEDGTAGDWLDAVSGTARVAGVHTLPYADVDASALTRGGQATDVVRSVTQGPRVAQDALGSAPEGTIYWAPFGRIDQPALSVLDSAGVTTVVVSADAMPATEDLDVTVGQATAVLPTDTGAMRAVLTDPGLMALLGRPQGTADERIATRQAFLAETATIAADLQEAGAPNRTMVAAPASVRWSGSADLLTPLLRATRTAPWLAPVTLTELLDEPASTTTRRRGGYGERARDEELTRRYVASITRASSDLATFTSIIDDPSGIAEPFSQALLRASSSAWRTQPAVGIELLESIRADIAQQTGRVRVLSDGTVTLSGDSGKVPVTIENGLDRTVTVGVVLRGTPSLRLDSAPLEQVRIEAGKMASVELQARVVGGEPLPVQIQLLDPEGEDYGDPATITVTSTAYARAASWVVIVAFVAIVIFVIVGVARRIHKASRSSGGAS